MQKSRLGLFFFGSASSLPAQFNLGDGNENDLSFFMLSRVHYQLFLTAFGLYSTAAALLLALVLTEIFSVDMETKGAADD